MEAYRNKAETEPVFDYYIGHFIVEHAVFDDVTERKKFENDLKQAKEKAEESDFRLKLATDSAKLGIWDWDVKKNILVWNKRMFELYGIGEDSFNGTVEDWGKGLHHEDKEQALKDFILLNDLEAAMIDSAS